MKPQKPLKDLPGFDEALAYADPRRGGYTADYAESLNLLAEAVIPGLARVQGYFIQQLAMMLDVERSEERRRIRLVPPPRLAANDCEAP